MAAAIIPLIAGLAPSIINLITSLIHQNAPVAETTYGPGTGPVKFADVFASVIAALQKAAAAGAIDKALPSDEIIKAIIQAVVTSMQMSGQLGETPAQPGGPASSIGSVGQVITVRVVGGTLQIQQ
jgi:hypothetical protein